MDKVEDKKTLIYNLSLMVVAVIWGANYVVVKVSLAEMDPLLYNSIRFLFGAVTCWIILIFITKESYAINKKDLVKIIILSIIHIMNQFAFVLGMERTSAGDTSIILASTPMWVALIAYIIKIEKIDLKIWTGISISFLGCFMVITQLDTSFSFVRDEYMGNLLILIATFFWSLYSIYIRMFFKNDSIIKITAYSMTCSSIIFIMLSSNVIFHSIWNFSMKALNGAILSGTLVFGVSIFLWNNGVKKVGATRTSIYANFPPVVSLLLGWLIIGEKITFVQMIGGFLIIFGLYYINYKKEIESTQDCCPEKESHNVNCL